MALRLAAEGAALSEHLKAYVANTSAVSFGLGWGRESGASAFRG
jgi:hypothetical protein